MRRGFHLLALIAALLSASSGAAAADRLAAARQRGELVVGVPYLAPAPAAGAKIRTPEGLDIAMAERLAEYQALGVDTFVLSGYPHHEEAIRFAELVFPLIGKDAVTLRDSKQTGGAFDLRAAQRQAAAS